MIDSFISRWSSALISPRTMRLFRACIYLFVLYNTLVLSLPMIDELWGEHSLVLPLNFPAGSSYDFFMLMHDYDSTAVVWTLFGTQVLGLLLFFVPRLTRLSSVLVYLSTVLLFNRVYLYNLGGNYLLHLMLFYLMFINENRVGESDKSGLSTMLSNMFFWAARVQVMLVYFFSAVYKLAGDTWLNGEALQLITLTDEFSTPWFQEHLAGIDWLMASGTYLSLAYLCLFPILIWIKRLKPLMLAIGIAFHLTLGIVVGVMDFSLIMIACYTLFVSETWLSKSRFLRLPGKERTVAHP